MEKPEINQKIYVPSAMYVYHGADDFAGGLATINNVKVNNNLSVDHYNYIMVGIAERPNHYYNWKYMMENQSEWKKIYGDNIAHPDPDYDDEFNNDYADWK